MTATGDISTEASACQSRVSSCPDMMRVRSNWRPLCQQQRTWRLCCPAAARLAAAAVEPWLQMSRRGRSNEERVDGTEFGGADEEI